MGLSGVGAGLSLFARVAAVGGCCLALAHCGKVSSRLDPKYGVSASPRVVQLGEPVPKGGGVYRVGKPYTIGGRTYSPEENAGYSAEGTASWYGEDFHGRMTANGEVYDMESISAAHPTLPIPSYARVTNLGNKRSIIVRVNDRGPYHQGRLIDVSVRAAKLLGFYDKGTARVRVDYVGLASLAGSDDTRLEATLRRGTPAPGPSEVRVASSRPFLPQFSDPSPAMRGPVPTPPDRPFELGHEEASTHLAKGAAGGRVAAVTRQPIEPVVAGGPKMAPKAGSRQLASSEPPHSSFEARFAPAAKIPVAATRVEPVSAFASSAPGASSGAVMTGRGLY
jgi:rare lipoprotein A